MIPAPSVDRYQPAAAGRRGRIRLSAWILGALAIFFYFGFIGWNLLRELMSSGAY